MGHRGARLQLARLCIALALLGGDLRSEDTIHFKNGNVFEGEIIGESEHALFVRLSTGTVRLWKHRIQRIERDAAPQPEASEPDALSGFRARFSEEPAEAAVFLRDWRRVPGEVAARARAFVAIDSTHGRLLVPQWLVDDGDEIASRWRFTERLENPADPELLEELAMRHEALVRLERRRVRPRREDLDVLAEKSRELDSLVAGGDADRLRDFALEVSRMRFRLAAAERERARDLAVNAFRAAGDAEERTTPASLLRAADLHARSYRLRFSGDSTHASVATAELLRKGLRSDPRIWGPALSTIEAMEGYAWWSELDPLATAQWRKRRAGDGPGAVDASSSPFLVESEDGSRAVTDAPPPRAEGIVAVWKLVRPDDAAGEGYWWRIFWCPVERGWRRETVPEVVAGRLRAVYDFLARHIELERVDVHVVFESLREYQHAIDGLLTLHYDPGSRRLKDDPDQGWRAVFRRANDAIGRVAGAHERSLRRRAVISEALERALELHRLLAAAAEGTVVDLARCAPVPAVTDPVGGEDEIEAITAALAAFDVRARLATLEGEAIRAHARDASVAAAVGALAESPLSLPAERAAAEALLEAWGAAAVDDAQPRPREFGRSLR